jgi:hypothetical protein
MIFYITMVLSLIVLVAVTGGFLMDVIEPESIVGYIFGGMISLFIGAFCSLIFAFMVLGTANIFIPKESKIVDETTVSLRALDTGSEISGRYFVGSAYISEKKVLEYISEANDGGMRVESVPADKSVIYERDEATPKLVIKTYEESNSWLAPEALYSYKNYEFSIPKGSVKESYSVSVGEK